MRIPTNHNLFPPERSFETDYGGFGLSMNIETMWITAPTKPKTINEWQNTTVGGDLFSKYLNIFQNLSFAASYFISPSNSEELFFLLLLVKKLVLMVHWMSNKEGEEEEARFFFTVIEKKKRFFKVTNITWIELSFWIILLGWKFLSTNYPKEDFLSQYAPNGLFRNVFLNKM